MFFRLRMFLLAAMLRERGPKGKGQSFCSRGSGGKRRCLACRSRNGVSRGAVPGRSRAMPAGLKNLQRILAMTKADPPTAYSRAVASPDPDAAIVFDPCPLDRNSPGLRDPHTHPVRQNLHRLQRGHPRLQGRPQLIRRSGMRRQRCPNQEARDDRRRP